MFQTAETIRVFVVTNTRMRGLLSEIIGGADGTRTRDPRRDRPVF